MITELSVGRQLMYIPSQCIFTWNQASGVQHLLQLIS